MRYDARPPTATWGASEPRAHASRAARPRVVALGGGHGLHATLSALRRVVTTRPRSSPSPTTAAPPAGCAASSASCRPVTCGWPWRPCAATTTGAGPGSACSSTGSPATGEMNGHVVGNLLIVSLWELLGDHVTASGVGRPAARRRGHRAADGRDADGHHRRGARHRPGAPGADCARCAARSSSPPPRAGSSRSASTRPTRRRARRRWTAVLAADWVVLGPGSWYTSVIPHLLVPALRKALVETDARLLVVLNLEGQAGETHGYGPEDHLAALHEHGPDLRLHTVLADPTDRRGRPDPGAGCRLLGSAARGRRRRDRRRLATPRPASSWPRRSGRSSASPTPRATPRAPTPRGQGSEGC